MRYLKAYENWVTNIFKSYDYWQDYADDVLINQSFSEKNFNSLMGAAMSGNWKRFKDKLPKYIEHINDIHIDDLNHKNTTLTHVVTGIGDLWEKRKMIEELIENGADPYFEDESYNSFYDLINNQKLKEWFNKKYPQIVEKLLLNKSVRQYNI